ncbi:hypothetical protein C7974DRAFT_420630 [Boeremia exigua]|uniref:uncharacterized protein n=1 Tax=Boeremia exigua TaxID=749465 RepID=UPI001E8CF421|nr:uncharacterized protein C7974DRAFT_420630 [Boeremia exigua]KAH6642330.1 hypothetical protein C7974DRAFT_420630 [Boeremia exigua]
MTGPRVDTCEGFDEVAQAPDIETANFTYIRGGATATERAERGTATSHVEPSPISRRETLGKTTIIFETHDGHRYVLPYLPWETTKTHIEDIYRVRRREALAEAIKEDRFTLSTEGGNIILPSLWNQVVEPAARVQITLPVDVLNSDIPAYDFDDSARGPPPPPRPRSPPRPPSTNSEGDRTDSDDASSVEDLESSSSESEIAELPPVRQVITPTDEDGNLLVFKATTKYLNRGAANANNASNKRESQIPVKDAECISIAKAVSTQGDGRTSLQIFLLPGPRTTSTPLDESIRWFHLRSAPLDFTGFKETCLSIPGLSKRLQEMVKKTFDRVEKEKLKAFLDGMFIEPGTVLRGDESDQSDPESVIFSCLPYFDLQIPAKKAPNANQGNRFSSRTLMQSYYPYEPVQDRDVEQAYRKFGNEHRDALVHVPNLWTVNIGSKIVATCSHEALSHGFVQSIKLIAIDGDRAKNDSRSRNIRLTDWNGRKLLYTVKECATYIQMEQKLRELRWCSTGSNQDRSLKLTWQLRDSQVRVTPRLWASILGQKDNMFIELSLANDVGNIPLAGGAKQLLSPIAIALKPFFHWPQKPETEDVETNLVLSDELKRSIRCLELTEKAMTSQVLSSYYSEATVEDTFTSIEYYRTLPQATADQVKSGLRALEASKIKLEKPKENRVACHEAVVFRQRIELVQKTSELCNCFDNTLALFVADVDKSTMLRKSWAAMQNICEMATTILRREPLSSDPEELADNGRTRSSTTQQAWFVRLSLGEEAESGPLQKLTRRFEKCRPCTTSKSYNDSQTAMRHAQRHFRHLEPSDSSVLPLKDCIVTRDQRRLEVFNETHVAILTKACKKAQRLLTEAKELAHGVLNEEGQMSDLYTFPCSLLNALRQQLVFYFAVERAMFFTEKRLKDGMEEDELVSYSDDDLLAIEKFGNGVQQALAVARTELCSMVKSTRPPDVFERLSLSPEYVCGWFMRRLIVKPLSRSFAVNDVHRKYGSAISSMKPPERNLTVSDMYREYLSTIQFQVNHRPGKRLLRSINLLQEEIAALLEVNTQQSRLISNYMSVLDDTTFEKDIPSRRAMFPHERMLLQSCQDNLRMTDQEYRYMLARCGPLSDSTKQSLEINEEDHGKAILVFTVVTVIFLPLSFVTSFLGMNTTDIRDMGSSSTLFWAIAIPLTAVTMGSVMYIGYNGDDLRDACSSVYRTVTGKQDRSIGARGISVAQRNLARRSAADSKGTLDFSSLADEAEFANPRPEDYYRSTWRGAPRPPPPEYTLDPPMMRWEPYASAPNRVIPKPAGTEGSLDDEWYQSKPLASGRRHYDHCATEILRPEPDYTETRQNMAGYRTARRYRRPEVRTYNEPIVIEYGQRRVQDDDEWYTSRPRARVTEQHNTPPPQYEWTRQGHKHQQDRHRRRRRRRSQDEMEVETAY